MIKTPSPLILSIAIGTMINGVNARKVKTTTTTTTKSATSTTTAASASAGGGGGIFISPFASSAVTNSDCTFAVDAWKAFGKSTAVSAASSTACCYTLGTATQSSGIPGVTCTSSGSITKINWASQGLDAIPFSFEYLKSLQNLDLSNNPGLTGGLQFGCSTQVYINTSNGYSVTTNTGLTICPCPAETYTFASLEIPDECVSIRLWESTVTSGGGAITRLRTSVTTLYFPTVNYIFSCHTDLEGNPYVDCLNIQAKLCSNTYMGNDATLISGCKTSVKAMVEELSPWWQNVRRECGQWPWQGYTGNYTSQKCIDANSDLIKYGYYVKPDGTKSPVTSALTNSVNTGLWSNVKLKG